MGRLESPTGASAESCTEMKDYGPPEATNRAEGHQRHGMTPVRSVRTSLRRNAMNAKELVEAATNYKNWSLPHGHPDKGFCAWLLSDVESARRHRDDACEAMADHILSTVHPDDDEPVTRERLEDDGWFTHEKFPGQFRHDEFPILHLTQSDSDFRIDDHGRRLKSMGHLRRLVAALGE